ncbi:CRP-like cAMP-binding protein [Arcticibacter tournemirensis]|uniref:Crp/Fnr family transcriptional regulator n=1 Tax=Arcticibacter tournemirensis TaxID=699437 RepID=A0A4Q0M4T5_9SPHI|nr:Crp/Fnr family transcriptional regulator [Arcticibacter tournemirensis]KAA8479148.1 Crp/Fnr family transcriptional regulator [Arcticibacter tournemirensis]RXF67967.1 Crp/Fnr family transcriptional regulator [Arcticibacter tournemirensis]TQM48500.1 CRP-like cAMP-binding protein [Arcticibacter tournemirensis]
MLNILKDHIEKFAQISDEEFEEIKKFFDTKDVAKKENLLEEGQICKHHYFVLKGLLRKFFINEKGTEQTTEFAIETWWLTDNFAYENKIPSDFYIQAVEQSTILYISQDNQEKLLTAFPIMERYFRFVYQRAYAAAQRRIQYLFTFSKEAFYFQAVRNHPEFVQRVPQYLIASYLGFTPEYLSEIRKRGIS